MTIQKKAAKFYAMFETKEWENGLKRVVSKEGHSNEVSNITFAVNQAIAGLSMDSVYNFTLEALSTISDCEDIDEGRDSIEADIYTNDLTSWLNESNGHVYFLTEVLEEYDLKDGFQVLGYAQLLAKREVFDAVVSYLEKV